ncbi:MAG: peroxiredoxin [Flavobacteriales bacterium]|nr:peroxiredoxin [Flavobacteriales bacterium]
MNKIKVGDQLPTFTLQDQNGNDYQLHPEMNKILVIYFYPKDDTPGCTKEACSFRDEFEAFTDLGAEVIGISSDDVESHRQFAEKYRLPFTLLADTENTARNLFGVPKSLFILPGRTTYLVDKSGIVQHIFNSQLRFDKHVETAIEKLKEIQQAQ